MMLLSSMLPLALASCIFLPGSTNRAAGFGATTSRSTKTTTMMPPPCASIPSTREIVMAAPRRDDDDSRIIIIRTSPLLRFLPSSSWRRRRTAALSDSLSSPQEEYDRSSSLDDDDGDDDGDDEEMGLTSFRKELDRRGANDDDVDVVVATTMEELVGDDDGGSSEGVGREDDEFDGYDLRDVIREKWGECFDVEFQKVDSYGFRSVYLNIMPFRLGGRRFRHETEYDYLCHLQAVVEILVRYNQLEYVLVQMGETTKKPRAGTSPLVAVPLRLDLTPEQVEKILG